jgi:hypothetical protein
MPKVTVLSVGTAVELSHRMAARNDSVPQWSADDGRHENDTAEQTDLAQCTARVP